MKQLIILSAVIAFTLSANAQKSAVYVKEDIAINGYDPVAYFTEGKPVKGSNNFTHHWNNAGWRFSNKNNLDSFTANPGKYAPQFGGYCAYGMADGHKAPTEPDAFTIVNGRLYLNYNKQVQQLWLKDQSRLIQAAEQNWPVLKDKE